MKSYFLLLIPLAAALAADVPEPYKTVERVVFVVADADAAAAAWARTGLPVEKAVATKIRPAQGTPISVRLASAFFEDATADFIQPVSPGGPFSDFLKSKKGGVMALVHAFPNAAALDAEVSRLSGLAVRPLLDATWQRGSESKRYVLMDTAAEGKYVLALTTASERKPVSASRRIVQYAFAAKSLDPISAYWAKLALPAFTYTHPDTTELIYRGKPGQFDMRLGWQRHGKVTYEWIQPLRGPSTYYDHFEKHGEGFHHLAFNVDDMDSAIKEWSGFGFPFVMGGAWGEKGKPGSGRFAYHDLDKCCGAEVELLWNYKAK